MLKQALEVFKKMYEEKGDRLILDSYIPSEGTYVIVKPSENGFEIDEVFDIKMEKDKTIDRSNRYFDFVCMADYYSGLLDMNKPIDSKKKIHSNNYLSFFVKKDVIEKNGASEADLKIAIKNYYDTLIDLRGKYKKKEIELYQNVEEKIGIVNIDLARAIEAWVKDHVLQLLANHKGKNYLKIFFYEDETCYQNESKRYFIPKLYNNVDFNVMVDNIIYGLPNDNMGLNAKKPFLEHKTRKNSVPYLISEEEVLLQKKFFDYLLNLVSIGKVNIYMNDTIMALGYQELPEEAFNGMYFRIKKGKEVEIHDFDSIADYTPQLMNSFFYTNYLYIDYEKLNGEYGEIQTLKKFHQTINEVLFSKMLVSNYFTEGKEIASYDSVLVECILLSRNTLFDYFYKGRNHNVSNILNRVSLKLVKNSILNGYWVKAMDQFNLRMSLKSYFEGGENMADTITAMKTELKQKMASIETLTLSSDKEYYFAIGQLVQYFISKSKGKKKPLSLVNPFINAKKDTMIKLKLKAMFKKYNYDIEGYPKFKNLFAMVMSYEPQYGVDDDMIIAGYLHNNLLYEKSEE